MGHEVIVVDGGSHDNTQEITCSLVDKLLISDPGRAKQMNHGAKNASGDVFLFLHGDSIIPVKLHQILIKNISNDLEWGMFSIYLSGNKIVFRIIERFINLRSRLTNIATGDQGIFVTKKLFKLIEGYPNIPLMEDIAICRRLKNYRKPIFFKQTIITSSRRWEERGIISTILLMWKIRLQYYLGKDPKILAKLYD